MQMHVVKLQWLWAVVLAACTLRGADFQATQTQFTESDGKNTVVLEWIDPAPAPGQVEIRDRTAVIATVTGVTGPNVFVIQNAAAGEHTYSASGAGGSLGSQVQTVLESSGDMLGAPDSSKLTCRTEGAGEECEIVIDWKTGIPPPTQYEVFVDGVLDHVKQDVFPTHAQIAATSGGEHRIMIQPVTVSSSPPNVGRYERPALECTILVGCVEPPSNRFLRGLCDGIGRRPGISSAIIGLNYLFLGGPRPPCVEACDANASGAPGQLFDLSDMVFMLSFLFLGGPAPPGWRGTEAVCEGAMSADDCLESHADCMQ